MRWPRAIALALPALVTAGLCLAPAPAASAAAKPAPAAAKPTAGAVKRMTTMLAYEPGWLSDSKRLAFLGNRQEGDPSHIYVWEPGTGKLFQATTRLAKRHSLVVSREDRLAYVEHGQSAPLKTGGDPDDTRPADGPDTLVVQDLRGGGPQALLAGAWVLPHSLAWSPDGSRLSFITLDRTGAQRLALVTPGSPMTLINLDGPYRLRGMVGWANAREVVLRATSLRDVQNQSDALLVVGHDGVHSYRDAENARLSPDGRWLLAKNGSGVALRLLSGGLRILNPAAYAYDWAPEADKIYAAVNRDVLLLDLKGRELKRWSGLANLALGQVTVSPDGKSLAFSADYGLSVLPVRE